MCLQNKAILIHKILVITAMLRKLDAKEKEAQVNNTEHKYNTEQKCLCTDVAQQIHRKSSIWYTSMHI